MATKSKTRAKEEQGEAAVQLAEAEKTDKPDAAGEIVDNTAHSAANAQTNTSEEKQHDEQTAAETAETQEAAPDPEKDVEAPALESSELLSLSVLAARHRVASWQQAALCRYMGWADGKMLTDAEYGEALKQLAARHLGGGRRK